MHIGDGYLPIPVIIGGFAGCAAAVAVGIRRFEERRIPDLGVVTSLFFVASLVHIPVGVGGTSVHLLLNGLSGIVLGWLAFPSVLVGLFFQSTFLLHGGLTTLGVNTVVLGSGALLSHFTFRGLRRLRRSNGFAAVAAFLATFVAVFTSGIVYILAMLSGGPELGKLAEYVFLFHLPVAALEAAVTATTVSFVLRVKPEMLEDSSTGTSLSP